MRSPLSTLTVLFASLALSACSSGETPTDGGDGGGFSCVVGDASYNLNCNYDAGFTQAAPNTPNTLSVTFSGETLGISGLPYTPVTPGDPYFIDGWSVYFDEYIVVVDNVRLNTNPTSSAIWQQMGPMVANKTGPFVIDAHHIPLGFVGKDGVEPASPLFVWNHLDDGSAFTQGPPGYAFSYDIVQATYPAISVNLPPNEIADYDLMVKNHWSKFIRAHASHDASGSYDDPTNPDNAAAMAGFAAMPQPASPNYLYFAMGWDDQGQLLNCVNTDNGDGVEDNLNNRGVQTNSNGTYVAQLTIHTDHLFWDTILHEGEPLRFDPIAARAPQGTTFENPFFVNDMLGQGLSTTFPDSGTPIPDRGPYMTGNGLPPFVTDQSNPNQVIMNTNGNSSVPNDYRDFMVFSVQSQPHLNAQGLCYVVGQHPSDPYFVPNVQAVVR